LASQEGLCYTSYLVSYEHVEWIQVDQDKVKWQALMNTVMNIRVP